MADVSEKHREITELIIDQCEGCSCDECIGNVERIIDRAIAKAEREGMKRGYLAGFKESGEGWNAEYPFQDQGMSPEGNAEWVESRDRFLSEAGSD